MIVAEWTGKWPNLCCGQWKLYMDGKDISNKIPDNLKTSEMNTYNIYKYWSFTRDWDEDYVTYANGLQKDEWIKENKEWLDTISTDYVIQSQIFDAINAQDWRHKSCGGCI